jgi:hypothetical protein
MSGNHDASLSLEMDAVLDTATRRSVRYRHFRVLHRCATSQRFLEYSVVKDSRAFIAETEEAR